MSEQTKEQVREDVQNPQNQPPLPQASLPQEPLVSEISAVKEEAHAQKAQKVNILSYEHSEKLFGNLAPLARVLSSATSVLEEETRLVASRSSLSELRNVAQQKETLLTQHDLQLLRLKGKDGDLSTLVSTLDKGVRTRLRTLYESFEEALRQNGLRLKAALQSSEMLLAALSEAAQAEHPKGPQLYTPQGRLSETDSAPLSLSRASQSEV